MTDSELREAAERVARSRNHGFSPYGGPGRESEMAYDADAEACATRLLELLPPADDGEAVTADWLKAVGFLNEDEDEPTFWTAIFDDLNPAFTIGIHETGDRHSGFIGEAEDNVPWPHDIVSRSQVRDICRALGVTLKETK